MEWAEDNANNKIVILLPYLGVLIPLNLLVYHDVIDKRWRTMREIAQWSVFYGVVGFFSSLALSFYAVVQFADEDFKEGGAALLSLTVPAYGLYLFARQAAILSFFRKHLQRRVEAIVSGFVGNDQPASRFQVFFPGGKHEFGPTHGQMSSVFLDDNYPGEGPRVTWLKMAPVVRDWTEMMIRAGLWIRLAVVPAECSLYSALREGIRPEDKGKDANLFLWTISSLKLAFLNPAKELERPPSESTLKDFVKCIDGEEGTLTDWLRILSLAPASEWAQALSELRSAWIEGIDSEGVAWEVFLALALHRDMSEEEASSEAPALGAPSRSPVDFKGYVEGLVRKTLEDHEGHVTTGVLMGAFPEEDDLVPLKWLKRVNTLARESYRLAGIMTRERSSMPEETLCVGVDLVVALASLLNAKTTSFKFSPESTWGGLQNVLEERHKYVLGGLEREADVMLNESHARRVRNGDDVAQASYSLGKFLHQSSERGSTDKATTLFKAAFDEWERSEQSTDVAKGLNNKAQLLEQTGDLEAAATLYRQALAKATDPVQQLTLLNQLARLLQKEGKYDDAKLKYKEVLDLVERPGNDPLDVARALTNLAVVVEAQGDYKEASTTYAKAVEKFETSGDLLQVAACHNKRAGILKALCQYKDAREQHACALRIHKDWFRGPNKHVARDLHIGAEILREQGKYTLADVKYQDAIAMGEKVLGLRSPELATWLNNRGLLRQLQGKYQEAMAFLQRSLFIREQELGLHHPDVAQTHASMALVLSKQDKLAEAKEHCERSWTIREEALAREHPDAQAESLLAQGNEGESLDVRAMEIWENVHGRDRPVVGTAENNWAALLSTKGKFAEAQPWFQAALDIREDALGEDHPATITSCAWMADLYKEAGPLFERSLVILEKTLGRDYPAVAKTLRNRAGLFESQGENAEAEALYKRCQAIDEEVLGPDHPDVLTTLNKRVRLLMDEGNYADAVPLNQRAMLTGMKALGRGHSIVVEACDNLAELQRQQAVKTSSLGANQSPGRGNLEIVRNSGVDAEFVNSGTEHLLVCVATSIRRTSATLVGPLGLSLGAPRISADSYSTSFCLSPGHQVRHHLPVSGVKSMTVVWSTFPPEATSESPLNTLVEVWGVMSLRRKHKVVFGPLGGTPVALLIVEDGEEVKGTVLSLLQSDSS